MQYVILGQKGRKNEEILYNFENENMQQNLLIGIRKK